MSIAVAYPAAGDVRVAVTSTLDYALTQELDAALVSVAAERPRTLLVDLTGAGTIDDAAIGVMFRALREIREHGGAVAVCLPDQKQRAALEVMGLDRLMLVTGSRDEAERQLASS